MRGRLLLITSFGPGSRRPLSGLQRSGPAAVATDHVHLPLGARKADAEAVICQLLLERKPGC